MSLIPSSSTLQLGQVLETIRGWWRRNVAERRENLPVPGKDSSLSLERLSPQDEQERANILWKLHKEPPSINLQAYFGRLNEGSPNWDIETFIEGIEHFARLSGPERGKYYDNELKGLHYPDTFTKSWNRTYFQPITLWDQEIRYQCPITWSKRGGDYRVLAYEGDAPWPQGLNHIVTVPTTLDSGMECQLKLWFGLRYMVGDRLLHKLFPFGKGRFILTQVWDRPLNEAGTEGNLLYPFYDCPPFYTKSPSRIRIRRVFNHARYFAKHPGGWRGLQNVIQVDGFNFLFDPAAPDNILSDAELEEQLRRDYNNPRDFADLERLWLYATYPDHTDRSFSRRNYRRLAKEAKKYEADTLNHVQWNHEQPKRERDCLDLHFNFERLVRCLEEAKVAYHNGTFDGNILARAREMQLEDWRARRT